MHARLFVRGLKTWVDGCLHHILTQVACAGLPDGHHNVSAKAAAVQALYHALNNSSYGQLLTNTGLARVLHIALQNMATDCCAQLTAAACLVLLYLMETSPMYNMDPSCRPQRSEHQCDTDMAESCLPVVISNVQTALKVTL